MSSADRLRKEFLELLESDVEFRYAVAGYLGLSTIMEELRRIREEQTKTWKNIEKLWENVERLWREVRSIREEHGAELKKLWEGQEKLWEEVRELRKGQERLWKEVKGLRLNFRQLGRAVGMTLEFYTAAFLEGWLEERGYPGADVRVGVKVAYRGRLVEFDLLCEEPLVVGEVTTYLGSAEEAEREVEKLLERVKVAQEVYGRGVELAVIAVANLERGAAEALEKLAEKHRIIVVTGREVEGVFPA